MNYISTRNGVTTVSSDYAILSGIAEDGGLYVPKDIPKIDIFEVQSLANMSYAEASAHCMIKFLDEFSKEDIQDFSRQAYAGFSCDDTVPLVPIGSNFCMELYHGPTMAFKDMALQMLPFLMQESKIKQRDSKRTLILVATSGDTGKAALDGFADADGIDICVFYPADGVSPAQRLQMVTQKGSNVHVCAVKGNFDDTQTGVKALFLDENFNKKLSAKGYALSSANSINWGRLLPQISYYIWAYAKLLDSGNIANGEKINFVVPTGNFGNILAAYYAMLMGLPVNRLICASNSNNVLTDFFNTGDYVSRRPFFKTLSPSMDILISSNLERLLFETNNRDAESVKQMMFKLKEEGSYTVSEDIAQTLRKNFWAGYCSDVMTKRRIKSIYSEFNYVIDPHTAVGFDVYSQYREATHDLSKTVLVSTASPFKFCADVLSSLDAALEVSALDDFELGEKLCGYGLQMPDPLNALKGAEILHNNICSKEDMGREIETFLSK